MNLTLIRYFLAVAETGSFTRGAERANVAQPTLSAGIKRLEAALGAPLFDRGKGAQMTAAGSLFLPRASLLLQEWTAARRDLRDRNTVRTRLRLGYMTNLPGRALANLLGGFSKAHPDTALDTLEAQPDTLRRRLDLGRIDAALLPLTDDDGDLCLPVYRQRYLLAVPQSHPLSHRTSARIVDLRDQPFVIRAQAPVMPAAERLFEAQNVRPRIVGRAESDAVLRALVEAGIGMAILPHWLADGSISALALPELRDSHRIGLVWREDAEHAVAAFRDFCGGHDWDAKGRHSVIGH